MFAVLVAGGIRAGLAIADKGNGNRKKFDYSIALWGDLPYSDVQAQAGVPEPDR